MNKLLPILSIMAIAGGLLSPSPTVAQVLPPAKPAAARPKLPKGRRSNRLEAIGRLSGGPATTRVVWTSTSASYITVRDPMTKRDGKIPHQVEPEPQ